MIFLIILLSNLVSCLASPFRSRSMIDAYYNAYRQEAYGEQAQTDPWTTYYDYYYGNTAPDSNPPR